MINRFRDWKLQIAQLILPLVLFPVFLSVGVKRLLFMGGLEVSDLEPNRRFIANLGDAPVAIVLVAICFIFIRKYNKDKVLKQNLSVMVWHTYLGYWVCRSFLNYRKVSLVRVPIPVQFKLVFKGIFDEYDFGAVEKNKVDSEDIRCEQFNDDPVTNNVNLVLMDTYPLELNSLPPTVINLTTIVIDRPERGGGRCFSKPFVDAVNTAVHALPPHVDTVNVFSTLNPAHVHYIAERVFKTGGRDNIKWVCVYQQTEGKWVFKGSNIKVKVGK